MIWPSLVCVLLLASVHLVTVGLRGIHPIPRQRWLSFAGGVSVAYVFLHLLPELSASQERLQQAWSGPQVLLERHAYLLALLGLAVFYGLDRLARTSRAQQMEARCLDETSTAVFWLHMVSFGIYNALIGYVVLRREEPGMMNLALFTVAMALHVVINDVGLRAQCDTAYHAYGRWVLAAAPLVGWLVGLLTEVHPAVTSLAIAFLGGGIILNVLKEELPGEHEGRFGAFALGAGAYGALLLFV